MEAGALPTRRKRFWTDEEDRALRDAVDLMGQGNWERIAATVGSRKASQCRDRWQYHLRPDLNREPWTQAEDQLIEQYVSRFGRQWSKIAGRLHARTCHDVKNRYKLTSKAATAGGGAESFPHGRTGGTIAVVLGSATMGTGADAIGALGMPPVSAYPTAAPIGSTQLTIFPSNWGQTPQLHPLTGTPLELGDASHIALAGAPSAEAPGSVRHTPLSLAIPVQPWVTGAPAAQPGAQQAAAVATTAWPSALGDTTSRFLLANPPPLPSSTPLGGMMLSAGDSCPTLPASNIAAAGASDELRASSGVQGCELPPCFLSGIIRTGGPTVPASPTAAIPSSSSMLPAGLVGGAGASPASLAQPIGDAVTRVTPPRRPKAAASAIGSSVPATPTQQQSCA
jgi:hypothetical protein